MDTVHISLPNNLNNFLLQEMWERLKAGETVIMAFGGASMQPIISGRGEKVTLRPLSKDEEVKKGEVYLFFCEGHFIIHRLMKIEDGVYVFRGDNCYKYERVTREKVLAKLMAVERPDGTMVDCEGEWWRKRSRQILRKKNLKNFIIRIANRNARRKWAVAYFVLLALLMWAPVGALGISLDNFIFGLRVDHLLHAAVYIFCAMALIDWLKKRPLPILLTALAIGLFTEFVQYLLPYRGFDINDLVANCLGVLVGWLAILPFLLRHRKH